MCGLDDFFSRALTTGEVVTTRRRDYISAAWAVIYQVSTLLICYSEAIICLSWQYKDSGQKVRGRIFREQVRYPMLAAQWLLITRH